MEKNNKRMRKNSSRMRKNSSRLGKTALGSKKTSNKANHTRDRKESQTNSRSTYPANDEHSPEDRPEVVRN
jgi:hypothetical protein